jgi:hypothetical protein
MLDGFLKVAYAQHARVEEERTLLELVGQLPLEDIQKLAFGEPLPSSGSGEKWLDTFKGTPMLEEAIALEQEEIQADMTDLEQRKQRRATDDQSSGLWELKDQIRIKKRLLDLRLAEQDSTTDQALAGLEAPPVADPAAPTEATPPVATGAELKQAAALYNAAMSVNRAGSALLKLAGAGGALAGLGSKALGIAKTNPALVGAGVGAAGGALAGGPDHRLSGALGGAALGAGAGAMAPGVASRMSRGQSLGTAAKGSATGLVGRVRGGVTPQPHGALSAAPVHMSPGVRADPSVLHAKPQAGGAATLAAPNLADFAPSTWKQRVFG